MAITPSGSGGGGRVGGAGKGKRQPQRQSTNIIPPVDAEWALRRVRRHLVDLERSNYTEPSSGPTTYGERDGEEEDKDGGGGRKLGATSGAAASAVGANVMEVDAMGKRRKKSTMAVRSLLLYRKTLATLIEESNLHKLPSTTPSYLTSLAAPSAFPPLQLCSVCGYKPTYTCQRCGLKYCDLSCKETHDEARCERR